MKDLKNLAQQIAGIYAENPNVEAVLLGGSVSRNWQDQYSDIELLVFWKQVPGDEERKKPILESEGIVLDFHPFEDEEWSETWMLQGVKLEISNFLTASIHRFINKTIQFYDTDPETQCIVAAIDHGVTLSGKKLITEMKERVSNYPDELSKAMILKNSDFGGRWSNRDALLYRQDWLMLYKVMADVQTQIMALLFGLNHQYVVHPGFKWQRKSLEGMVLKPEDLAARMESSFLGNPHIAVKELEAVIQDVFGLIAQKFPELELAAAKKRLEQVRPRHDID